MTPPLGQALRMQIQLQRLFEREGFQPQPVEVGLAEDIAEEVIIEGLASTRERDFEHCVFKPFCFGFLTYTHRVPLLYRHDPSEVAGTINDLGYDEWGQLTVKATVTHPKARRATRLSVGAKILEYSITDNGGRDFFATITRAEVTDVSLVVSPCNPHALVTLRRPLDETELLIKKLVSLQSLIRTALGAPT
ncbi:HK97 family phage prohead protease [Bradyrhizobium elkanii]